MRDPWHEPGESPRSRFLPSPSHLFSANAYSLFKDRYYEVLWKLERALVEDRSSLRNAGKVWYYYERPLPALSGTVLFWVRELSEEVEAIISHASLFGVGRGRASGNDKRRLGSGGVRQLFTDPKDRTLFIALTALPRGSS